MLVDEAAGEDGEASMARHLGSAGAPPDAGLIVVTIGDAP